MVCQKLNYTHQLERLLLVCFLSAECISCESRDRNHIEQHLENSRMNRSIQLLQNLSAACRVPSPQFKITLNWPHFDMWVSGYVAIAFSIGNKFSLLNWLLLKEYRLQVWFAQFINKKKKKKIAEYVQLIFFNQFSMVDCALF